MSFGIDENVTDPEPKRLAIANGFAKNQKHGPVASSCNGLVSVPMNMVTVEAGFGPVPTTNVTAWPSRGVLEALRVKDVQPSG